MPDSIFKYLKNIGNKSDVQSIGRNLAKTEHCIKK